MNLKKNNNNNLVIGRIMNIMNVRLNYLKTPCWKFYFFTHLLLALWHRTVVKQKYKLFT